MMSSSYKNQRRIGKCSCGKPLVNEQECEACRQKKKASVSRGEQNMDFKTGNIFNYSFNNIKVKQNIAAGNLHTEAANASHDEDDKKISSINQPQADVEMLPARGEIVQPLDTTGKDKTPAATCPTSTEVAATIDMRSEALTAGFGTAYGIHAKMRVRPDDHNWNGTAITESLTTGTNSCPDTLTKGEPCSGGSTFSVGAASGNSPVLSGPRPGVSNHFWDFHTTQVRPKGVSVLHDAKRNPDNLDKCSTVCNQQYSCGGNVIGKHTITRTYTKGVNNGTNVTFVDVTKK